MSDRVIAIQMMLMAHLGKDHPVFKPKKNIATLPFPELLKELDDYIHSKEYMQLMIDELEKIYNH